MTKTTYIKPEYTINSGRITVEGVKFASYRTGILRNVWIEDGQIEIINTPSYLHNIRVIGHGYIMSTGKRQRAKRFRTREAAIKAAFKIMKPK